ncbi:hypothetical protein DES40_0327 [Litorimonas taeanensis]|uniref:Divergent polysaccharide deacetylase n=1 Tax=Litorimonas taeanensis TaxID=568099 RepID=A0A420WJA8_9PROT|nr:divergent polysaccharide deacetylase family protein [Litorimonas taeanensis]RKQ71019.1 hypothetical protein DES40_0327 [Litorimonas taeanensis]
MGSNSHISVTRRQRFTLPKKRWHVLGAILVLAFFTGAIARVALSPAIHDDPNISGELPLSAIPQPLPSTHLNADNDALPDLLAGDVLQGENPTIIAEVQPKTDALGNPVTVTSPSSQSDKKSAESTPAAPPKPKMILIDGKTLNGGSTNLYTELVKNGPLGPLPVRAQNGKTAYNTYRKATELQSGKQAVSLIIGGLGINRPLTQQAIDILPAEVTLSFAAQSEGLQDWINIARADGHEVLLEIPMESADINASEAGVSRTLKAGQDPVNHQHLDWLLSRAQGYYGVTNYNGDKFLLRADATVSIFDRFAKSGLAFITDGAVKTPTLDSIARSVGLPFKQGFGLIDPEPQTALIDIELSRLAAEASQGNAPIGVGFAYPETLQSVNSWIATLPAQSLQLVPASTRLQ